MTIRRSFAKKAPPDIIDTATAATTTVLPLTTVRGDPSTQATMTPPPRTPLPRTPTTPTTLTTPGGTRATQPKPKQREEETTEKTKLKKSLQQKLELREKGMVILVEKAECFESNNYRNVSTKELDVLLNWYGVEKKAAKKAEKVAQWKEIRVSNTTANG